ncbi:MAG: hypothetical protein JKX70_00945 [Phycisphaerales bacterium]|nr:hypothetical protein [Phycisphaerales bacterium]
MTDQPERQAKHQTRRQPARPNHHEPDSKDSTTDMVCVTLQRPPHFWRFACAPSETGDLLERLAEIADDPNIALTWSDAELIASEIVIHHQADTPSAGQSNDR